MSLSLSQKVLGSSLGVCVAASASYGIYTLSVSSEAEVVDKPEEDIPETKVVKHLNDFKGLDGENYPENSLAKFYSDNDFAWNYLSTGKENEDAWKELWGIIKEDDDLLDYLKNNEYYEWIRDKFKVVKVAFDENKGEHSLNGLCESIYLMDFEENDGNVGIDDLCSSPLGYDDDEGEE